MGEIIKPAKLPEDATINNILRQLIEESSVDEVRMSWEKVSAEYGPHPANASAHPDESDLNAFALEEAALALMQMHGGPGEPRRDEARIAAEAYLSALAAAPAAQPEDGPRHEELRAAEARGMGIQDRKWTEALDRIAGFPLCYDALMHPLTSTRPATVEEWIVGLRARIAELEAAPPTPAQQGEPDAYLTEWKDGAKLGAHLDFEPPKSVCDGMHTVKLYRAPPAPTDAAVRELVEELEGPIETAAGKLEVSINDPYFRRDAMGAALNYLGVARRALAAHRMQQPVLSNGKTLEEVRQAVREVAAHRTPDTEKPCPKCGQVNEGQYGEYPCSECGLPREWGTPDVAPETGGAG